MIRGRLRDSALRLASRCYSGTLRVARMGGGTKPSVIYVGDSDWVLSTIGKAIRHHLEGRYRFGPRFAWRGIRNSLIHWGSPPPYFSGKLYLRVHPSNVQIVNWTHGQRSNPNPEFAKRLDGAQEAISHAGMVVCHSMIGMNSLLQEGVEPNKLVNIPHGIDTELFRPPTSSERSFIRSELNIPETAYCIGSFQKDGEGQGEGMTPKWVKGPDVFLDVIDRLRLRYELCVLLTGPARGYIKAGLKRMGVSYRHVNLKDYRSVARHFWALDAYVIASRDEGGPMALLESMASGVPLVSTRVGMCIDLIEDGKNAFLSDIEDAGHLAERVAEISDDGDRRQSLIDGGLTTARSHTWATIARQYDEEVYRPLITGIGP